MSTLNLMSTSCLHYYAYSLLTAILPPPPPPSPRPSLLTTTLTCLHLRRIHKAPSPPSHQSLPSWSQHFKATSTTSPPLLPPSPPLPSSQLLSLPLLIPCLHSPNPPPPPPFPRSPPLYVSMSSSTSPFTPHLQVYNIIISTEASHHCHHHHYHH
ncbi:hypothetical protein E2C01_083989 [Portunus trituberculatus]|uniref:Uncharacterized protein n=1 Tax=Portunus trituberculatus TaxID=210409 RepID=A0A5B7IU46_PORTR|nr:hypothetical protein [Portunus trituberculatus]